MVTENEKHQRQPICSVPVACCSHRFATAAIVLFLTASAANNDLHVASAFSFRQEGGKLGNQIGGHGHRSFIHPLRGAGRTFSHPDIYNLEDKDSVVLRDEGEGEIVEIINGTSDGLVVAKTYLVPLAGFREANEKGKICFPPSSILSLDDTIRLQLQSRNVTLPVALMLLDPDNYPTQSRARKAIRKRSICICRNKNNLNASALAFDELGKVISRVFPGDAIGFQHRAGSDYYAAEGVPYRPPPFDIQVVYEDDHMAIVNKPAGVLMYREEGGRGGHGRTTLISALPFVLKPSNSTSGSNDGDEARDVPLRRPQAVHRLDRPTSGLLVVAKTKAALVHISRQFEHRKAKKTYRAIVSGIPKPPLSSSSEWNTIDYDLEGKSAITNWRAARSVKSLHGKGGWLTLVELKPKTGRYHQLRRHMAWVCNSPIVGDTTYFDDADDSALRLRGRGLFLCANEIELEHPFYNTISGKKEWIGTDRRGGLHGDVSVWAENGTSTVMIKATIALPNKFDSFLDRENGRAMKFMT